jgi:hypothetical protein
MLRILSYCSVHRFKYQFYLNVHYFRAVQGLKVNNIIQNLLATKLLFYPSPYEAIVRFTLIRLDCYMWATRIRQINRTWIGKRPYHFKGSWKRENTALWVFSSQRTTKYVRRNIEAILLNHCCSLKAVSIAYSDCVFSLGYPVCNSHALYFHPYYVRLYHADWQLACWQSTQTYNTYQLLYINSECLLMMGNKYARNM